MKKILITTCLFVFYACVKDKPEPVTPAAVQVNSAAKKVYVINEGNFGSGNASISLYDPSNGQVVEDIYKSQNNLLLGDVAQSMLTVNGKFYVVVNNSGKIVVCDEQFKKTAEIKGLSSPRFILPITNQKAYVSDLKSNSISVIDLSSNTMSKTIPCGGWTERMVLIYNKVYVTNLRREFVYVINTLDDKIADSVYVGPNAASLVIDKNDKIWVLSGGDQTKSISAKIVLLDPLSPQVMVMSFPAGASPSELCQNKTKDTLYFLDGGIFRMAITDQSLPANAFVYKGGKNFYGMGVDPNTGEIYASDALDYVQRSNIYVYDNKGNQSAVFKAGINANGFYFE